MGQKLTHKSVNPVNSFTTTTTTTAVFSRPLFTTTQVSWYLKTCHNSYGQPWDCQGREAWGKNQVKAGKRCSIRTRLTSDQIHIHNGEYSCILFETSEANRHIHNNDANSFGLPVSLPPSSPQSCQFILAWDRYWAMLNYCPSKQHSWRTSSLSNGISCCSFFLAFSYFCLVSGSTSSPSHSAYSLYVLSMPAQCKQHAKWQKCKLYGWINASCEIPSTDWLIWVGFNVPLNTL